MKQIALMGLGQMGAGIAESLLRAGFSLSVYNRSIQRAEKLAAKGTSVATSPAEAAQSAAVVISMVSDDDASRNVWLGKNGALQAAPQGAVLVECSTLSLAWIRELAVVANRAGKEFLDAPVNGGPDLAASGQLRMQVGGPAAALERARPALTAFTSQIEHMGGHGCGALSKLIHNMIMAAQIATLAEGLAVAERGKLNLEQVIHVITNSGSASPVVKRLAPLMATGDYGPATFTIRLLSKDLAYALQAGQELGLPLSAIAGSAELFDSAIKRGLGEQPSAAVIESFRQNQEGNF